MLVKIVGYGQMIYGMPQKFWQIISLPKAQHKVGDNFSFWGEPWCAH